MPHRACAPRLRSPTRDTCCSMFLRLRRRSIRQRWSKNSSPARSKTGWCSTPWWPVRSNRRMRCGRCATNMVEGGRTPILPSQYQQQVEQTGPSLVGSLRSGGRPQTHEFTKPCDAGLGFAQGCLVSIECKRRVVTDSRPLSAILSVPAKFLESEGPVWSDEDIDATIPLPRFNASQHGPGRVDTIRHLMSVGPQCAIGVELPTHRQESSAVDSVARFLSYPPVRMVPPRTGGESWLRTGCGANEASADGAARSWISDTAVIRLRE